MSFTKVKDIYDYSLISIFDPAIDKSGSDMDAYENEYSYDQTKLVFYSDQKPTRFYCKPLSNKIMVGLFDRMMKGRKGGEVEVSIHEAALLAFRHGVFDMENMPGFDASLHIQKGNPPLIKEKWLENSCLPIDVIVEIGSVILAKSRLSETERKN